MNKKELVKITKYLNDKDINRGSSGNLSYRTINGFVITPSSSSNNSTRSSSPQSGLAPSAYALVCSRGPRFRWLR